MSTVARPHQKIRGDQAVLEEQLAVLEEPQAVVEEEEELPFEEPEQVVEGGDQGEQAEGLLGVPFEEDG